MSTPTRAAAALVAAAVGPMFSQAGEPRVKMSFPASLAGDIPFHCHLVDHEDNGMMAVLRVIPPHRR